MFFIFAIAALRRQPIFLVLLIHHHILLNDGFHSIISLVNGLALLKFKRGREERWVGKGTKIPTGMCY